MPLLSKIQSIFIQMTALIMNNLYLWRLIRHYSYKPETITDILKYSFISASCCIGLWLATTDIGLKYKKITSILILPSFIITPILVTAEYYFLTALVVSSGILAFLRIFRGVHGTMAIFIKR
jgi:hypothetical protein